MCSYCGNFFIALFFLFQITVRCPIQYVLGFEILMIPTQQYTRQILILLLPYSLYSPHAQIEMHVFFSLSSFLSTSKFSKCLLYPLYISNFFHLTLFSNGRFSHFYCYIHYECYIHYNCYVHNIIFIIFQFYFIVLYFNFVIFQFNFIIF